MPQQDKGINQGKDTGVQERAVSNKVTGESQSGGCRADAVSKQQAQDMSFIQLFLFLALRQLQKIKPQMELSVLQLSVSISVGRESL